MNRYACLLFAPLAFLNLAWGEDDRLQKFLQKFPKSDLNGDGSLTLEEAREFRAKARPNRKGTSRSSSDLGRASEAELAKIYEAREYQGLLYRFLPPPTMEEGARYPLILSLHGAGGKGTDNLKNLKPWNGTLAEDAFRKKYPAFVVVPQSPGAWKVPGSVPDVTAEDIATYPEIWQKIAEKRSMFLAKAPEGKLGLVFQLLDSLAEELPIDRDRVYVLGHSMGGFGSFEALAMEPDRFAAAIPSAGGLSPWHDPIVFKHVPVWAFHGDKDTTVPFELSGGVFQKLQEAGGNMKLTTLGEVGHGSAGYAFGYEGDQMNPEFKTALSGPACDATEDVWEWLFAQKRNASLGD